MATVNPTTRPSLRRRMLLLGVALVLGLAAWFWGPLGAYAQTGAAYGARVACSCRYVGGRDLGDCKKDFEPGMELVMLSEDAATKSVTASFPLLASETASYHPGLGCQLEPWRD
ncbi:MAG: hypothetical protein ABL914_07230 [Novosphingobium sp.]|uniref:hypothetical protein n=1 Tax=Novosphingobium sp. TaxID=1874826 RepID=UPI0032BE43E8